MCRSSKFINDHFKDCVIVPIPSHHFLPVTGSHHLRKWCEHYPEGLYRFVTQKSQNWSPKSEEVRHRDRHKILSFLLIFVGSCFKQVFSSLKMIFLNYKIKEWSSSIGGMANGFSEFLKNKNL